MRRLIVKYSILLLMKLLNNAESEMFDFLNLTCIFAI